MSVLRKIGAFTLLSAALAGARVGRTPPPDKYAKRTVNDLQDAYDYIVVGGGTSGLVVANRLSEDPDVTVLVVEYGGIDTSWDAAIPWLANNVVPGNVMGYTSIPQIGLNNVSSALMVGAVVGGGSQVNGMSFERGSKSDYDSWEDLGNPGWGWDSMFEYFKKATTFTPPKPEVQAKYNFTWDENTYGDGPIQVGFPSWQWPDTKILVNAWVNDTGLPRLTDHGAGGNNVGCENVPLNIDPKNVTRSTARTGYYDPVSNRENLHLLVRHYVELIEFDANKTAVGINIVSRADQSKSAIKANKEVVLAAGAVNTPKLLQLSGVGPVSLLESLNITVVSDLPGVGANFQDHPAMRMAFNCNNKSDISSTIMMTNRTFYNASYAEYMVNRTGPMSMAHTNDMVFQSLQDLTPEYASVAKALEEQEAADFLPDAYSANTELMDGFLAQRAVLAKHLALPNAAVLEIPVSEPSSVTLALEKPLSRGTIMIQNTNADPRDPPVIDFGAMRNPFDMRVIVLAVQAARRYYATPSMLQLGPTELSPGPDAQSDEEIEATVRGMISASLAHPSGTASLLPREHGGVVDPELRVYGVKGLRVVDASIIPLIPACHLQSTVYAIAEKAADIIKGLKD